MKVVLHGKLAKMFLPEWNLDVKTPEEAFKAININTNWEFSKYIQETFQKGVAYKLKIGDEYIDTREKLNYLSGPVGKSEVIHVFPAIGGKGVEILVQIVVAVILSVVSALLMPSPDVDFGKTDDNRRKDSYLFSGGPRPARQGLPVPIGYGEMMVFPTVIASDYVYERQGSAGSVDTDSNLGVDGGEGRAFYSDVIDGGGRRGFVYRQDYNNLGQREEVIVVE